ncbi:MAG: nucleotide-binding protein [Acidobacteriaceae bacterium]|nr:nucleotide-binding protein [Acidobacteriaceae bacterium]MBV9295595.1 nucleotide-binding protein [Acidobacteriaceae bacterium]MBV9766007.1 nucleotide-binding protein [Acidobacteriaceae bacterium]
MKKLKTYPHFNLSPEGIRKASEKFLSWAEPRSIHHVWEVATDNATTWTFDSVEEFLAEYKPEGLFQYIATVAATPQLRQEQLIISRKLPLVPLSVTVESAARDRVQELSNIVESHLVQFAPAVPADKPVIRIFIGHGRNGHWRDLKDHLQDQHGYKVEAYETGARAGHSIRDILEDMLNRSSIAFLVLTGEDETSGGGIRARQNVIHEAGLFQGRLGFSKALMLVEEGVEEFSNVDGIKQIKFPTGRIRETFGDVLAVIKREFEPESKDDAPQFSTAGSGGQ